MGSLNHFFAEANINPSIFKVYYDFATSGDSVSSVPSGESLYSGELSSIGEFWSKASGSGYFTGQYVKITNQTGLYSDNWTTMIVYEKLGQKDAILFSSLQTGLVNGLPAQLGYLIGVNASNKLYYEGYDPNGPYLKTFNKILGTKNSIAVSRSSNSLTFSYYNFTTDELESDTVTIDGDYIFNSDGWYLGNSPSLPSYWSGNAFSGYMDEFLYFSQALSPNAIGILNSGFFATKAADYDIVTSYTTDVLSGYAEVATGIQLVTGYDVQSIGTLYDGCGAEFTLYKAFDLTGLLTTGNTFVPIYSGISYDVTGQGIGAITIDSGYVDSFGMDGVTIMREIDNIDYSEIYLNHSKPSGILFNKVASYDIAYSKFKLSSNYNNDQITLSINGVAQIPSGYSITGGVYNSGYYLSGDYFIDNGLVNSSGAFDVDDSVIYDLVSGARIAYTGFSHTIGTGDSTLGWKPNYDVYFNGIKLFSGENYTLSGDYLIFGNAQELYDGSSGNLLGSVNSYDERITGQFGYQNGTVKFARGTSQLWFNGQRQTIDQNYLEASDVDFLNGSGVFTDLNNVIYNSDDTFWE